MRIREIIVESSDGDGVKLKQCYGGGTITKKTSRGPNGELNVTSSYKDQSGNPVVEIAIKGMIEECGLSNILI